MIYHVPNFVEYSWLVFPWQLLDLENQIEDYHDVLKDAAAIVDFLIYMQILEKYSIKLNTQEQREK